MMNLQLKRLWEALVGANKIVRVVVRMKEGNACATLNETELNFGV